MAQRQKAVSTLLKEAQARIAELEKKLSDKEGSLKYATDGRTAAERELESVHDILDALSEAPAKKVDDEYRTRTAATRLAAYFAKVR